MKENFRRLFIGLPPDEPGLSEPLKHVNDLIEGSSRLKAVPPENYHITLRFIGQVSLSAAEQLTEGFKKISFDEGPVPFDLYGLGCFPDFSRPSVIWAGMRGDVQKIRGLQRVAEYFVSLNGFEREKRRFIPHITLARVRRGAEISPKLREFIKDNRETCFASSCFSRVVLYESVPDKKGAVYSPLAEIRLG